MGPHIRQKGEADESTGDELFGIESKVPCVLYGWKQAALLLTTFATLYLVARLRERHLEPSRLALFARNADRHGNCHIQMLEAVPVEDVIPRT